MTHQDFDFVPFNSSRAGVIQVSGPVPPRIHAEKKQAVTACGVAVAVRLDYFDS
jgi:hypothetical protein